MIDSREPEQAVLGAALLNPSVVDELASELRLRPEHFAYKSHRSVWEAMLRLRDEDKGIDRLTLAATMNGSANPALLAELEQASPVAGHYRDYAAEVVSLADWRRVEHCGQELVSASEAQDTVKRERAERELAAPTTELVRLTSEPDQLADEFWEHLRTPEEAFPFPAALAGLNRLTEGGMRRGDVTVISGWTGFGKSSLLDQVLSYARERGLRTHLFINEMTKLQRTIRTVARMTGIPGRALMKADLTMQQSEKVTKALSELPFGITDCTDLSVEDVCRVVRRGRYDVVGIDILSRFDLDETKDFDLASRTINKSAIAGKCHVLYTAHLNQRRTGATLPVPNLGDLRSSGMIGADPAGVVFVHREQSAQGQPKPESILLLRKNRHGDEGFVKARFDGQRARFLEADERSAG